MSKSIVTEYENISAFSGQSSTCIHHLVFGRGKRQLADEDGLWIPLTDNEHNMSSRGIQYQIHENPAAEKLSKMLGQMAYEKKWIAEHCHNCEKYSIECAFKSAREEFRKRYHESYL